MTGPAIFAVLGRLAARLSRPDMLGLYAALAIAWMFYDQGAAALLVLAAAPLLWTLRPERAPAREDLAPPAPRAEIAARLDLCLAGGSGSGRKSACFVVGLDEPAQMIETYGQEAYDRAMARIAERLAAALRERDLLRQVDGARFAVALAPARRMDLETAILIAGRLKAAVGEPLSIDAMTVYIGASVGFCLTARAPEPTGASVLEAAERAFDEARRNGPGGLRAYSADIGRAADARDALGDRIEAALEGGEIVAYFQPQISTDTGEVTGFEALARWQHPERGILAPSEFLPAVLSAGYGERLGEIMLGHALSALRIWDRAGLSVPAVAVNFSALELRNPNLAAKLKWELDRFDLTPDRLTVEVLESVAAETGNDVVAHNITALARLGCGIDLDDFGTGHASIAALRRLSVRRIKIDRSYVTRIDSDPAQQRMVTAILSMAERLGIETLAEGVETISEHALLAQLGCGHVQGHAIARPMPLQATESWLAQHRAKLTVRPQIARRSG
ncbi:MAG: GGDEF domain-containing protein [Rhodobacteraceae bacterium]|nr:GGDEF domain-containing protein [Paracoccaceae bacterium]